MSERRVTRFEKWEGLGNDFIVIELGQDSPSLLPVEHTRALCDRHHGIGADGILLVTVGGDKPRMTVLNADGSRPEMCGNGLRCVAAVEAEKRNAEELTLVIATDAGDKRCVVERKGEDHYEVTVDMGHAKQGPNLEVDVRGARHEFTTVDVGNPHAITFAPYEAADIDVVGPTVEKALEGGTNVEFCRKVKGDARPRIEVTVWERGVGRTLACGTGACAVAAAACEAGMAPFGEAIEVVLPGGPLEVTVGEDRSLRMKGPARRVFRGEVTIR
jgi:diaminopimelate epimerase